MKHKSHTVSEEWRSRKTAPCPLKDVRYRRKKVGEIRRHAPDKIIFWSKRDPDDVHYKLDAWGVASETLELLRMVGVKFIGIECTNGDRYIGRVSDFTNPEKGATRVEYQNRGGATVTWFLPRSRFGAKRSERGGLDLMGLPPKA